MEVELGKIFYSELPSRNVYVDSVVNSLPGYYPARSEFTVEYNNEIEQDLTDVCAMYDEIVHNNGEDSDEEDPLKQLLSTIKTKPGCGNEQKVSDSDVESKTNPTETIKRIKRKRKANEINTDGPSHEVKKQKMISLKGKDDKASDLRIKCEELDYYQDNNEAHGSGPSSGYETSEDLKVLGDLCLAAIEIYNNRLRERLERKEFVRNHGFLDQKKIYSWHNIHSLELGDGLFNILSKKFIKLFNSATEFDKFIQQLKLEKELRSKLDYLSELRRHGIRHKKMIPLYTQLKASRNSVQAEIKNTGISDIVSTQQQQQLPEVGNRPGKVTKMLEISHLPKYKLLDEDEKELCSFSRLTPDSYLNFKQIMITECKKLGGLKLRQARPLLKIDVNKTRKVYNYLIEKKLIWND